MMDPTPNPDLPNLSAAGSPTAGGSAAGFDIDYPLIANRKIQEPDFEFTDRMPEIKSPRLVSAVRAAVNEVVQSRSVLEKLGPRPDHETVDAARLRLAEIAANAGPGKGNGDFKIYKAVIALDEMHEAYGRVLSEAERKLDRIYAAVGAGEEPYDEEEGKEGVRLREEFDPEVVRILKEAGIERADLSGRELTVFPQALGKLNSMVVLNLSNNLLQKIPDSISGLENLQELNLSENLLESLPDSISLLFKLKILNVSRNKLSALPDSISHCRSLVELNASFNMLTYLPTDVGFELMNLQKLDIHFNKIRFLPISIGGMKSLRFLDVHFNELHGLPLTIGRLMNLETLDLSSNFRDLMELPDTVGELVNLKELDLSNNQIHTLPYAFGRLLKLTKLNLDQNPLMIPPKEVVAEGVEAVKAYMAKRWADKLVEEDEHAMVQVQTEANLLTWFNRILSSATGAISGYLEGSGNSNLDPCLDQQL